MPTPPLLQIATERSLLRELGRNRRYLHARLEAPRGSNTQARPPLDLALVLDRSGSMQGNKWRRAHAAALQAARRLSGADRLAVVVYDTQVDTVLELTQAGDELDSQVREALTDIGPRGGTDLAAGWLNGCRLVSPSNEASRLHRCFLLTDGMANHGLTDPETLARHASALFERGVTTSTFGIGDYYHEGLLGRMAEAGGGHLYDIAGANEIESVLSRELGDALDVVWRDAWLVLRAEPGVQIEALGSSHTVPTRQGMRLRLGDLVSQQVQDVLLELRFPQAEAGRRCRLDLQVEVEGEVIAQGQQIWTYVPHHDDKHQPRDIAVDRQVAEFYAQLARRDAALENRRGHLDEAAHLLRRVALKIRGYAQEDPELHQIADALLHESEQYARPMTSREAKRRYFTSSSLMRGRTQTGERRRSNEY